MIKKHSSGILIIFLGFMLVFIANSFLFNISHQSELNLEYNEIVIQPGDTLWQIAKKFAPDRDPRDVIGHIREKNHLKQATLYPGQKLKVPVTNLNM